MKRDKDMIGLAADIKAWGQTLGFQRVGISGIELDDDASRLKNWIRKGRHGDMSYMERHGRKRTEPDRLVPGTRRVISARMDYLPPDVADAWDVIENAELAFVSRYALGRDYHKVLRQRLQSLADRVTEAAGNFGYRVFVDSAPVMEKALARDAGLGWIGKHTNLLDSDAGSWFFLGEIYTDLPLPVDAPLDNHCGSCRRCLDICPTKAIVAPYELDATRCISYLTIEHFGSIPVEFRKAIGNRIYGCDDCQLICPWNKFATLSTEKDFRERNGLGAPSLISLFAWTESEFLERTAGSAIRRIGHERWLRNIAVALGNAPTSTGTIAALESRRNHESALVREHVAWALAEHGIN